MNHFCVGKRCLSEAELRAIRRRRLEHQLLAEPTEMIRVSHVIVKLQKLLAEAA
jgi:hypothetical protein